MSNTNKTAEEALQEILAEAPRSRRTAARLLAESGFKGSGAESALAEVDWQQQAEALMTQLLASWEGQAPWWYRRALNVAGFTRQETDRAMAARPGTEEDVRLSAAAAFRLGMTPSLVRGMLLTWGYDADLIDRAMPENPDWVDRLAEQYARSTLSDMQILADASDNGHGAAVLLALREALAPSGTDRAVRAARSMLGGGARRRQIRMELKEAGFTVPQVEAALRSLSDADGVAEFLIDAYMAAAALSLGDLREWTRDAGASPEAVERVIVRRNLIATDWIRQAAPAIASIAARAGLGRSKLRPALKERGYSPEQISYAFRRIDWKEQAREQAQSAADDYQIPDHAALEEFLADRGYTPAVIAGVQKSIWLPVDVEPDPAVAMLRFLAEDRQSEKTAVEAMQPLFGEERTAAVLAEEQPDWQRAADERLRYYLWNHGPHGGAPALLSLYLGKDFSPEQTEAALAANPYDWTPAAQTAAEQAFVRGASAAALDEQLEKHGFSPKHRAAARVRYDAMQLESADIRPS